jgi:hypothetical protein
MKGKGRAYVQRLCTGDIGLFWLTGLGQKGFTVRVVCIISTAANTTGN